MRALLQDKTLKKIKKLNKHPKPKSEAKVEALQKEKNLNRKYLQKRRFPKSKFETKYLPKFEFEAKRPIKKKFQIPRTYKKKKI